MLKAKLFSFIVISLLFNLNCGEDDLSTENLYESKLQFSIELDNLKDYYTKNALINGNEIDLEISSKYGNITDLEINGGSIVRVIYNQNRNMVDTTLSISNTMTTLTIFATDSNGFAHSDEIYFYSTENNIYSSTISIEEAKIKEYKEKYTSNEISKSDYLNIKTEIRNANYDIGVIENSKYSVNLLIKWEDSQNNEHSLSLSKVDLIRKIPVIESSNGYIGVKNKVIWTGFTDVDGYLCADLEGYVPVDYSNCFIRVYAQGKNTSVVDKIDHEVYYIDSDTFEVNGKDVSLNFAPIINTNTEVGKAFQVSQMLIFGAEYAKKLNDGDYISFCNLVMDDEGAFYKRLVSEIHIDFNENSGENPRNLPLGYESIDTILHEYSHHIQNYFRNISKSPGGSHYINENSSDVRVVDNNPTEKNKLDGLYLAWAEGWATYNGQVIQNYFFDELSSFKYACDSEYFSSNGVKYDLRDYYYYYDGYEYELPGEANDCAISMILYKLYNDDETDFYDIFSYGDDYLWDLIHQNSVVTFSDFVNCLYDDLTIYEKTIFGRMLAKYNISPSNITISFNNILGIPEFSWNGNGGSVHFPNDKFELHFLNDEGEEIFSKIVYEDTCYKPSLIEWNNILSQSESQYSLYIIAYATDFIVTGPYYSECVTFYI